MVAETEYSENMRCVRVSVPGRTEVAGNHQDHQGGHVIAAAVNRRITCEAQENGGNRIYISSEGQPGFVLDLGEADFALPREEECNTTRSLVRGVAAKLQERGFSVRGCSLSFSSDIPIGMGLSSSAAFELCAGAALLTISGGRVADDIGPDQGITPLEMAQIAMHVEQEYFGKPCGLMDQAACALGGMIAMDFTDPENPDVTTVDIPASWDDYAYLLVSTGAGHEDATTEYAGVAIDMRAVAEYLGIAYLRDMSRAEYVEHMLDVRAALGDMAALRALGFYEEFDLVATRLQALCEGDMPQFIQLTERSGVCSAEYLQNVAVFCSSEPAMVALALCRVAAQEAAEAVGNGEAPHSARIHGGGFGGTIQVILPKDQASYFEQRINELMGFECCMHVRLGVCGIAVDEGASHAAS